MKFYRGNKIWENERYLLSEDTSEKDLRQLNLYKKGFLNYPIKVTFYEIKIIDYPNTWPVIRPPYSEIIPEGGPTGYSVYSYNGDKVDYVEEILEKNGIDSNNRGYLIDQL